MNVAITRAKQFLWVVGNAKAIQKDRHWKLIASGDNSTKYVHKNKNVKIAELINSI